MSYHETQYRVPYADTDQMGVVYYANYLEYFERSRTEMLRDAGLPYRVLEEEGVILPVVEAHVYYRGSARYDDLLTFKSAITEVKGVRIRIETKIYCGDKLLVEGDVVLACVNPERKAIRPPQCLREMAKRLSPVETDC